MAEPSARWVRHYVPMKHQRWAFVKKLPSGIHVVGATSDGEPYEIAIHVRLLATCFAGISIQQVVTHDIESPTPDELQRDGLDAAKSRFACYQRSAIYGIDFQGECLGYYYKAKHPTDLWAQWLVLYSDFRDCQSLHDTISQSLVLMGLMLCHRSNRYTVRKLHVLDTKRVIEVLQKTIRDAVLSNSHVTDHFHLISLLRHLCESAGGPRNDQQRDFLDRNKTSDDNLRIYGSLVGVTGLGRCDSFIAEEIRPAVKDCLVFAGCNINRELDFRIDQLRASLPVAFPRWSRLPFDILIGLDGSLAASFWSHMSDTYSGQPSLRKGTYDYIFLFVVWALRKQIAWTSIRDWTISDAGRHFFNEARATLSQPIYGYPVKMRLQFLSGYLQICPDYENCEDESLDQCLYRLDSFFHLEGERDGQAIMDSDSLIDEQTLLAQQAISAIDNSSKAVDFAMEGMERLKPWLNRSEHPKILHWIDQLQSVAPFSRTDRSLSPTLIFFSLICQACWTHVKKGNRINLEISGWLQDAWAAFKAALLAKLELVFYLPAGIDQANSNRPSWLCDPQNRDAIQSLIEMFQSLAHIRRCALGHLNENTNVRTLARQLALHCVLEDTIKSLGEIYEESIVFEAFRSRIE